MDAIGRRNACGEHLAVGKVVLSAGRVCLVSWTVSGGRYGLFRRDSRTCDAVGDRVSLCQAIAQPACPAASCNTAYTGVKLAQLELDYASVAKVDARGIGCQWAVAVA